MKKINIPALFFLILAFAAFVYSSCFRLQTLNAGKEIPELTGRVVDLADVLTPSEEARVSAEIVGLEKKTGGQMAVLTLFSTGRIPIETYSIRVADAWKIGHAGRDNGAILILAIQDRRNRLEIGRGWEGPVTDARAGDILRKMAPFLKKGLHEQGITLAIRSVTGLVSGERVETPELGKNSHGSRPATPHDRSFRSTALGILLLIISALCTRRGRFFLLPAFFHRHDDDGDKGGIRGRHLPRRRRTPGRRSFSGRGGRFSGGGASGGW